MTTARLALPRPSAPRRPLLHAPFLAALALALAAPTGARGQPAPADQPAPLPDAAALRVDPAAVPPPAPAPALRLTPPGEGWPPATPAPPNWWLPPLEVLGVTALLNGTARLASADSTFHSTWDSFVDHLDGPWWYDADKFTTNQFGHPYQGGLYYAGARSLGHGFWVSSLHAAAGSLLWELGMELEPPSVNDQITTTVAGSFLGEILYRLANRILDGGGASPSAWRHLGAAAVSPVTGFNRVLSGNRYRPPPEDLPLTGELKLAFHYAGAAKQDGTSLGHSQTGVASARLIQGHPGSGHAFAAPFDYYDLTVQLEIGKDAFGSTAAGHFSIHGLLAGAPIGQGASSGLWGLFGSYDYLTPALFRASSSALGLGVVGQHTLGDDFLFQGMAVGSLGYGAGGSLQDPVARRDYHFGLQGVLFARAGLVWRDTLWLEWIARQYYVSGKATAETGSFEDMSFGQLDLTWRIHGPHSVKLETSGARRKARYVGQESIDQVASTIGIAYAWQLGDTLTFSGHVW